MLIRFGEWSDLSFDKKEPDRLIVVAYGRTPLVMRDDGFEVPPFLDETNHAKTLQRRFFHILPYGEHALNPFPEGDDTDERVWGFTIHYRRARDYKLCRATLTLRVYFENPVGWDIEVHKGATSIDVDGLKTINWYITNKALCATHGVRPMSEVLAEREATT